MVVSENALKFTRDEGEDRQAILHIEVEEDRVEKHLQRAHQKVAARINIPGFRKGKAPRNIVEQFVGRDYLLEEAMETLVPEAVGVAVEESDIPSTHTPPRVEVTERDPIVKIDATVALPPVATLGDYKKLKFDDELEVVTDEQIEEQIAQIQESQATWDPVKRAAKLGDLLVITSKGLVEGKEFANVEGGEFLAEAGSMNPVPGFAEQLKGMKEGGSKEFDIEIPADYPNEEFAGKTANFNVEVAEVKKKELPKLTDALAASLGEDFKTVAELRTRISDNLEAQAKDGLRRSLEEKIVDALVEGAEFEVSPMMIEHEAEHVLEDQQRQLAQYNIDFQQYMQGIGKTTEDIVAEAKDSAELRLKRMLVIDTLAEDTGASVSDEEVAAEIALMQETPQYANENLDTDEARDAVQRILRRRTAIDSVIDVTHKPKAAKAKAKKSTTAKKKPAAKAKAKPAAKKKPASSAKAKSSSKDAKSKK
ncbi:trigger factor [Candidatus Lucifugimonas marina]|uniref:Trigger factor n=1 Tax=Candidatus Lucifugimonas marina TaxID=3038979 RepID=A0AAJ6CRL8_9CHLR|nr:trigger factor [SAR202 cluster bacterium JH702]MDG0869890.1 trigger factor [SAR202 cluster bacterium JH639]WFG34615.1 trigger factor [SAR202 cluster bacterium JH545]WFG38543.1 trigger factor [SAR202 cluster bacterium JH1073]